MTTIPFNLTYESGCVIEWDMKYGDVPYKVDCWPPDLPDEGVHLQYSTNGSQWSDLNYFTPTPGHNPSGPYYYWNHYSDPVPLIAISSSTQFRWWQGVDSLNYSDNWGIDNVSITCNLTDYDILWSPGSDTTEEISVVADTTKTYYVQVSDYNHIALDSVVLMVYPKAGPFLGNDTVICEYDSIQLHFPFNPGSPITGPLWSNGSTNYSVSLDSNYLSSNPIVWAEFINGYGCLERDSITILLDNCVGLEEIAGDRLKIYPQPSTDMVHVAWPGNPIRKIRILSLNGTLHKSLDYGKLEESVKVSVSELSKGSYILEVHSGRTIIRKPLLRL